MDVGRGQDRVVVRRWRTGYPRHAERLGDCGAEPGERGGCDLCDEPGLDRVQVEGGCRQQLPASDRLLDDDDGWFAGLRDTVIGALTGGRSSFDGPLTRQGSQKGIRAVVRVPFLFRELGIGSKDLRSVITL